MTTHDHAGPDTPDAPALRTTAHVFAAAIAVAVAAYFTHLPGIDLPRATSGSILAVVFVLGVFAVGIGRRPRAAVVHGLAAGIATGLLTLLIVLGADLVEQPELGQSPASGVEGLRPKAIPSSALFVAGCAVVGALASVAASALSAFTDARLGRACVLNRVGRGWNATSAVGRFALVALAAVLPLVASGGMVTSTRSGLAIRDWPASDTAYMVLYPLSLMAQPHAFFEHSHRLLGLLAGLTVVALVVVSLVGRASTKVRIACVLALVLVGVQGLLGGMRVELTSQALAIMHGVLAQLIVALLAAVACWQSAAYLSDEPISAWERDRKLKSFATALFHMLPLQVLLGAMFRHMKWPQTQGAEPSPAAGHALYTHIALAFIVLIAAALASGLFTARAREAHDRARAVCRGLGVLIASVVMLQMLLGFASWAVVEAGETGKARTQGLALPTQDTVLHERQLPWYETLITMLHHTNGAILIGSAAAGAIAAGQIWRVRQPSAGA